MGENSGALFNNGDIWGKYCGIGGNLVVMWYLVKHTRGITSAVRRPVLTPLQKRHGRRVSGENTVVLWATVVVFGAITVVFGANMVVFKGKYCGILSKIQRGYDS